MHVCIDNAKEIYHMQGHILFLVLIFYRIFLLHFQNKKKSDQNKDGHPTVLGHLAVTGEKHVVRLGLGT